LAAVGLVGKTVAGQGQHKATNPDNKFNWTRLSLPTSVGKKRKGGLAGGGYTERRVSATKE